MTTAKKLRQDVGRLLVARIPGLQLDELATKAFREGTIGGVVLFKENGDSLRQLYDLNASIISTSFHTPIITSDQEGGAIQRFEQIITSIPSPMALSATGDLNTVEKIVRLGANQLHQLGFNVLLSPVLDVLTNPTNPIIGTRAYSDNPHKIVEIGAVVAAAIEAGGLVPVGKHFPGHGSTREDSHTDLAMNPSDTKRLWQIDLLPFRNLLTKLPSIMVGHIWLQSVDQEPLPASISKRVTTGILREYLGYEGLIMTDDMVMKAITARWGLAEACLMAVEAGSDLVLVCGDLEETLAVNEHIAQAIESGRLSQDRVNEAIERIEKLFPARPQIMAEKTLSHFEQELQTQHDHALAASCKAISILRGDLPAINSGNWVVVVPDHPRYPMSALKHLQEVANKRFNQLSFSEIRYSLDPSPEEAERLQRDCSERNCIYLTYRALLNQGQLHLGSLIAADAREMVTVAVDVPFDMLGLPAWENCLTTFDPSELAMEALAKVLLGEVTAAGICPVHLDFHVTSKT